MNGFSIEKRMTFLVVKIITYIFINILYKKYYPPHTLTI
jgi:hypothetical protein